MNRVADPHASDVSIIVVTYNSGEVIEACLGAAAEYIPASEIVVVDNGSTDQTTSLVTAHPRVRLVAGHGNVGFGAAVNIGAQAATGCLLLVLNPDAVIVSISHSGLSELRPELPTGIVGCRIQDTPARHHEPRSVSWGWRGELRWALIEHFLMPRELNLRRPRLGRPSRPWVAGAAFLVARDEFLAVGGFDQDFFLYYEDLDLSHAYRSHGLPIRTTDAVTVSHVGGRSSPRDTSTMTGYSLLGLLQYVAKWEGVSAARHAAGRCLYYLEAIEFVGRNLDFVPALGRRARAKQTSAARVRSWLAAAAAQPPMPGAYPNAIEALQFALRERGGANGRLPSPP